MYPRNDEERFTRLTLETPKRKITYDLPYEDVSGDDMVHGLATIMLGMTFGWDTILHSLADYLTEHGGGKYEVYRDDGYDFDHDEPREQVDEKI